MRNDADAARADLAARFAALSDEAADGEFEAACLVTRTLVPDVDVAALRHEVDMLVAACDRREAPWSFLRDRGFQGLRDGGAMVAGTRMDKVLARKTGIPIALGVLLIHVARGQGLVSRGINFPGHFLVRVGDRLIDPFEMAPVSEADCLSRLASAERPNAFREAGTRLVALRMLNNLKYAFAATARYDRALEMSDYQLAVTPAEASLWLERGEFWLRLGAIAAARADLERSLELAPEGSELARAAASQLERLHGRGDVIH